MSATLIILVAVVSAVIPIVAASLLRLLTRRGEDGYPTGQDKHKDQCPCDRCLDRLHRNIHRLEAELGIVEPEPPRNIVGARMSNGEQILTLQADRITAEYYHLGEQKRLQPVPWFTTGR